MGGSNWYLSYRTSAVTKWNKLGEVIKNIKGELQGNVTVNQVGGTEDGKLYLMEGDQLIKKGGKYVFATRYLSQENWHTVIPEYGYIEIKDELNQDTLEKRFKKAYSQEKKYEDKFLKDNKSEPKK